MNPLRWLQLGALIALLGAGVTGVLSYRHLAAKAATADARIAAAEASEARLNRNLQTLSDEAVRRAEFDSALRTARATVTHNLDQAAHEDPASADYLGQPIPQRVRDAYGGNGAPQR